MAGRGTGSLGCGSMGCNLGTRNRHIGGQAFGQWKLITSYAGTRPRLGNGNSNPGQVGRGSVGGGGAVGACMRSGVGDVNYGHHGDNGSRAARLFCTARPSSLPHGDPSGCVLRFHDSTATGCCTLWIRRRGGITEKLAVFLALNLVATDNCFSSTSSSDGSWL
jgi:hypothetical protein